MSAPDFTPLVVPPADHPGVHRFVHVVGAAVWIDDRPAERDWSTHFIGLVDGEAWWGVDVPVDVDPTTARRSTCARSMDDATEDHWLAAGRAVQLVEWARTHRFCGRCGAPTEPRRRRARDALPALRDCSPSRGSRRR